MFDVLGRNITVERDDEGDVLFLLNGQKFFSVDEPDWRNFVLMTDRVVVDALEADNAEPEVRNLPEALGSFVVVGEDTYVRITDVSWILLGDGELYEDWEFDGLDWEEKN